MAVFQTFLPSYYCFDLSQSEWTVNMGELAVDMKSYSMEDGPSLILVLGKSLVLASSEQCK